MTADDWDPLHTESPEQLFWTTTNAAEAAPGTQTPLSLTAWAQGAALGFERAGQAIGVLREGEGLPAPPVVPFYGKAAMSVEFLRTIGDRMPGSSGQQVVSGLIGFVPEGMAFAPTRRYYLNVARRFPQSFLKVPGNLSELDRAQSRWWRDSVFDIHNLDEAACRAFLIEALDRHLEGSAVQVVSVFTGVQPIHDALSQIVEKYGDELSSIVTAPVGGAEMEVVGDIWRASRGQITAEEVVRRHGFHGPLEGEVSSHVWREDPGPLRALIERYGSRPDGESPFVQSAVRVETRRQAELSLIAAAPPLARAGVRALLALARRRLHLRGVAKRSMLQGMDGIRAGARRYGEILTQDDRLDDPDDLFYLTADELRVGLPVGVKDLVARRRARRTEYLGLALPTNFAGTPVPITVSEPDPVAARATVHGIGVSPGVVEGVVRIVTDPSFVDVEDGEVLVATTTDPSWSSIMFVSSALVVDIGGALSHAAVVARELGIPCVVNTVDGSAVLRTGDRVRVDGRAGTVEILEAAAVPADGQRAETSNEPSRK